MSFIPIKDRQLMLVTSRLPGHGFCLSTGYTVILAILTFILFLCQSLTAHADKPTLSDFTAPYFGLKTQGTNENPKTVELIVIGWEPRNKDEPTLNVADLNNLFFGPTNSVAAWVTEASQGRYRFVPAPSGPVFGPFTSQFDWPFYWRTDPPYVREGLCGNINAFCAAWTSNPFKIPTKPKIFQPGDPLKIIPNPNYYLHKDGIAHYLDTAGFWHGHKHSYAEAIRFADPQILFSEFDKDNDKVLSPDEAIVVIFKASAKSAGYRRRAYSRQVPANCNKYSDCPNQETDLKVDGVTIKEVAEVYGDPSPPVKIDVLAAAIEEVVHLAVNLDDKYPDEKKDIPGNYIRTLKDPRRPGQLELTDAGKRPVHTSPYERLKWGWLNPQIAHESGQYTLQLSPSMGDALILYSPYVGTKEFFILENRFRSGFDRFRTANYQDGLALWHVVQDNGPVSNWGRRALFLKHADPSLNAAGDIQWNLTLFDGADPMRGYDLDDFSNPQNLRFSDGRYSRLRIRNISNAGPVMTVNVEVPLDVETIIKELKKELDNLYAKKEEYCEPRAPMTRFCLETYQVIPKKEQQLKDLKNMEMHINELERLYAKKEEYCEPGAPMTRFCLETYQVISKKEQQLKDLDEAYQKKNNI